MKKIEILEKQEFMLDGKDISIVSFSRGGNSIKASEYFKRYKYISEIINLRSLKPLDKNTS